MNGDLGHWPESHSSLYSPIGNDNHPVESGDVEYDTVYSTHLPADPADMDSFLHPIVSTMLSPRRTDR